VLRGTGRELQLPVGERDSEFGMTNLMAVCFKPRRRFNSAWCIPAPLA
jgi:hypothetical protein